MENKLQKQIEAVLFYKSEPVSVAELSRVLEVDKKEVKEALENLKTSLSDRGISLVFNNDEYSLTTSSDVSTTIEKVVKDELSRDLSTASLETLSIVAYKGPVSRREIEYIRGVNSSFSLRALLMRGLIEREASKLDERIFLYKPTTDLLMYLGISSIEELPQWQEVKNEMKKAEKHDTNLQMESE